jgi:hypothetical protein
MGKSDKKYKILIQGFLTERLKLRTPKVKNISIKFNILSNYTLIIRPYLQILIINLYEL